MKWISVKERVPPKDGTPFLCYDPKQIDNFQNAVIYVVRFEHETYFSRGGYIEAGGECYFIWEPTHWMPLPEPPIEVAQGSYDQWLDNLYSKFQPLEQSRWNQANIDTLFYAGCQTEENLNGHQR